MIGEWEKVDKKNYYAWRRWRSFRAAGLFDKQRRKSNVHKAVPGRLQAIFVNKGFGLENILCVHHVHGKRYGLFPVGEFVRLDGCLSYRFKNELDPDINREEFCKGLVDTSSWDGGSKKHNSLWDAYVIRECYKLLMK